MLTLDLGMDIAINVSGDVMVTLSSCEILDELRKFGIKTPSELIEFLEEYADYYTHTDIQLD